MELSLWGSLRAVLEILTPASLIAAPVLIAISLYLASRDKRRRKEDPACRPSRLPLLLGAGGAALAVVMNLLFFIVSVKYYGAREQQIAQVPAFSVSSEDLHDGVWDTVIGKTAGANQSPQLSWEPVEGASAYGILMIDTDARYWLHWKTGEIPSAGIPSGYAGADTYAGPYPPAGETHSYTVYVVALKQPDPHVTGFFDAPNDDPEHVPQKLLASMDVTGDGEGGNVIAVGTITGTYTGK